MLFFPPKYNNIIVLLTLLPFLSPRIGSLSDVCGSCLLWSFIELNDSLFPFFMPHPLPWKLSSIYAWNSWVRQDRTYDIVMWGNITHNHQWPMSPRHLIICCPLWPLLTFHILPNDISVPLRFIVYTEWLRHSCICRKDWQLVLIRSMLPGVSFVFYRSDHLYYKVPCEN